MSIFSNFKINSLRKRIIENNYKLRLERLTLSLADLPQDQQPELAAKIEFSGEAHSFATIMICLLFHPDSGIFKKDVGNLNEFNFDKLYQIIVIWYSWVRITVDSNGEKSKGGVSFCIDSLETVLGMIPLTIKIFYHGLESDLNLVRFALYRWCMLYVGHVDINYETMHENSPDCKKFIETIDLAQKISDLTQEEAEKALS